MDTLVFTRADRPRVKPLRMLVSLLPLALLTVGLFLIRSWLPGVVLLGVGVAVVTVLQLVYRGAWVKADAMGISFARIGWGRTTYLSWHEIETVRIVEARTQTGRLRTVKAVLRRGGSRTLPVLRDNYAFPDPDLERKVLAIRALSSPYAAVPAHPDVTESAPDSDPLTVEASWSRRDAKYRRWMWRYMTPLAAVLLLIMGAVDLGPTWSAHLGGGTRGTFTATAENCGRNGCTWTGDFMAADGSDVRHDVVLSGGGDVGHVGDQVPAIDTGDTDKVFPPGGGQDWITQSLLTLAGLALL